MEQTELDLREVFQVLRRRLWIILLLPVVAGLTAGIVSLYVLQPVYSASTTLWVIKDGTGQANLNDVLLNRNLTKTYAEVARSRAVMADVIKELRLQDVTIADLQSKVTVTPVRDTEILSFTIEDGDPVMAANLADAVARAFMGQIRTFMKVENVAVVDRAMVPTVALRPRPLLNIAIAIVLGGMAALGLAFLLEYLDTSIKSTEDVARHVGLPVLGVIPMIESKSGEVLQRRSRTRQKTADAAVEK